MLFDAVPDDICHAFAAVWHGLAEHDSSWCATSTAARSGFLDLSQVRQVAEGLSADVWDTNLGQGWRMLPVWDAIIVHVCGLTVVIDNELSAWCVAQALQGPADVLRMTAEDELYPCHLSNGERGLPTSAYRSLRGETFGGVGDAIPSAIMGVQGVIRCIPYSDFAYM